MKKVLAALSGGVDSSVAAAVLIEQGYAVTGLTMRLGNGAADCCEAAGAVCRVLGIEHIILPLENEFCERVIRPFAEDFFAGLTPNPCVLCNNALKFGAVFDYALQNGFDYIATGHYGRVARDGGYYKLGLAADLSKDQSYVLWNLNQRILSRLLLPLGGFTKREVREKAAALGLCSAQAKDSQDICFLPNGGYAEYVEAFLGKKSAAGQFQDSEGRMLGRHDGVLRYTVGQRKGLGIALGAPRYVLEIDAKKNAVVLGDDAQLYKSRAEIRDVNFCYPPQGGETKVLAKLRYNAPLCEAALDILPQNRAALRFAKPVRAVCPGQSAVFYQDGFLLGGGIIY